MLKPNTKSLLPDRFCKRIISAARIIFAAYIIEAYERVEQRNGSRPKANLWLLWNPLNKRESCSRCYLKSSRKTLSSANLQASIKLCRSPSGRQLNLQSLKSLQRLKAGVGVTKMKREKNKGGNKGVRPEKEVSSHTGDLRSEWFDSEIWFKVNWFHWLDVQDKEMHARLQKAVCVHCVCMHLSLFYNTTSCTCVCVWVLVLKCVLRG